MTEILACPSDGGGACYLFNWIFVQTLYIYAMTFVIFVVIKLLNRS